MSVPKIYAILAAPLAALAALLAASASAETLIYVTNNSIGTVDSGNPGVDNTVGGKGPLSYSLPSGYSTIGAKVSPDNGALFILASDNGTCQLFIVNTSGSNGSADLNTVDDSYGCTAGAGNGDFSFLIGSSTSASVADAYLVADGKNVLGLPVGGSSSTTSFPIATPGGSAGDIEGVVDVVIGASSTVYAVDAGSKELVQLLNLNSGETNVETNIEALPVSFSGNTSLDYSTATGNFYLYTDSALYGSTLSGSTISALGSVGTPPGGTLAVTVAGNVSVTNNSTIKLGAIPPAVLLPLAGLALLRRRRAST